jgi:hypothetical protein
MTDKISEMTREEYAIALRAACREIAAPLAKPRKPTIASEMTEDEYRAAKRAINAPVRQMKP